MKEYIPLSKEFYKNPDSYLELYEERFNSEASTKLPFFINGHQSFFMITPSLNNNVTKLYQNNAKIVSIINHSISSYAKLDLINKTLKDEMMLTNSIEGVYSTRQEVTNAIVYAEKKSSDKSVRFSGLAEKFIKILNHQDIALDDSKDIRNLYNDIVLSEIDKEDYPDGEIFRKEPVKVVSATQRTKHKSTMKEEEIIEKMDEALQFVNSSNEEICLPIKIAIMHYYFGYIHPFYDGNGRMSRFISSYFMTFEFNEILSVSLSSSIKSNIKLYYDSFDICNDIKNKGDLTPFINNFIYLLVVSSNQVLEKLVNYMEMNNHYSKVLNDKIVDSNEQNIMHLLVQNKLYSDIGISKKVLASRLDISSVTLAKYIDPLVVDGYVEKEKIGNKYYYTANLEALD